MGSSVRKTSAKIKKLLKETLASNPNTDSKEVIPHVAEQTLRSKKTKGYFGDKDFVVLAGGGFACFKKAKEVGFDIFIQEYNVDVERLTLTETQKIIEAILDGIEEDNGDIDSVILLTAFQSAMTDMLMKKLTDPAEFLYVFCTNFITMIIREDICEALTSEFKKTSAEVINESIQSFSDTYVKKNFASLINECNKGEIKIEELLRKMQEKLGKDKE